MRNKPLERGMRAPRHDVFHVKHVSPATTIREEMLAMM